MSSSESGHTGPSYLKASADIAVARRFRRSSDRRSDFRFVSPVFPKAQANPSPYPLGPLPDLRERESDFEVMEPVHGVTAQSPDPLAHGDAPTAGGDPLDAELEPFGGKGFKLF